MPTLQLVFRQLHGVASIPAHDAFRAGRGGSVCAPHQSKQPRAVTELLSSEELALLRTESVQPANYLYRSPGRGVLLRPRFLGVTGVEMRALFGGRWVC